MGRKAAYHVRLADGREVGFGLITRGTSVYSVQFLDASTGRYVARSTRETARPRALAVIRLVMDFLRNALAASVGGAANDPNAERLKAHVGPEELAEMLEACDEAYSHIESYAQLEIVIEQLMDRLTVRRANR